VQSKQSGDFALSSKAHESVCNENQRSLNQCIAQQYKSKQFSDYGMTEREMLTTLRGRVAKKVDILV